MDTFEESSVRMLMITSITVNQSTEQRDLNSGAVTTE
jgi:hypothetical protein